MVHELSGAAAGLAAALLGSGYLLYQRLKGPDRVALPHGFSLDRQALPVKGQPGVWKSALMNGDDDVIYKFYAEVKTIYDMFIRGKQVSRGRECCGSRTADGLDYDYFSYVEVHEKANRFANALVHEFRCQPGNTTNVGIYARNCPQWLMSALACVGQSMVIVPLYDTLGSDAAAYIVSQAEISVVVVDKIEKARLLIENRGQMPTLKTIVVIESAKFADEDLLMASQRGIRLETFENALDLGARYEFAPNLPKPKDTYIICYTSGTTGTPKGVVLTHGNVVSNISAFLKLVSLFKPNLLDTSQIHISYLPLSHMMEQITHWTMLVTGSRIGYFRGNIQGLTDDMLTLKPTVFPVVPRLLNRLYDVIQAKVKAQGFFARLIYNFAFARKLSQLRRGIISKDTIWDRFVFKKIQAQIGGRVSIMVTGSAPISATVLETCRVATGALIAEGYGQTECTALATFTWLGDPAGGHCGGPAPCSLLKLGDVPELNYFAKDKKGEIRIKGPSVTKGYYNDPERTAELFDEDGFLQTGDIGEMLPNGTIRIIDRKKHIFKLAQGEYVAPEKIENVYVRAPVVQQVYVDGDSLQRWLIAVVVPEAQVLFDWNKSKGRSLRSLEEICADKEAQKYVLSELHAIGKENKLNSIEQVKKVILTTDVFTVENGLLTPTLKAKRPQLRQKYKAHMAKVYAENPNL
ncbi:unnamed protein product [Caenorhabditis auriculariae]|uniref:Long-chain-fatty-acid--CoA ligase n=1 Tax=Caenorhabditis auriculariae TaxID=2777116 RepID=A0A8S1GXS7_9PELO|nr:unnamed protein product [Caenorhabditis auriculariae]